MKATVKITLLVCIPVFLLTAYWLRYDLLFLLYLWSKPSAEQIEKRETEYLLKNIEEAKQDGILHLYPDWFYNVPDFYANKQFVMIHGLTGIRELYLIGYPKVPVAKTAIENLSSLSDLEKIYFQNVMFATDAMSGINGLPELRELSLYGCDFDATSLEHLATLTQVKTLKILCPMHGVLTTGPPHTIEPKEQAKIVETLERFAHLKKLILQECFRSDEETLRQHLPDTEIEFNDIGYDIP